MAPALVTSGAHANESGETIAKTATTTGAATTPSGLRANFSVSQLMSGADAPNAQAMVADNPLILEDGTYVPPLTNESGINVGMGTRGWQTYAFPREWSNDNRWHPAYRVTIDFSQPVVDPILALGGNEITAYQYLGDTTTRDAETTQSTQLRFDDTATGPSGSVAVSATPLAGFNTGLFDVADNTISPKLINGHIPYQTPYSMYCAPTSPETSSDVLPILSQIAAGRDDIHFVAPPCGSIKLDTGGKAITSIGVEADLSYLSLSLTDPEGVWNGAGWAGTAINVSVQHELSGSTTPATLGAATHVVGDLRLGDAIVPALTTQNISTPQAGTADDNSDAGYLPDSDIQRAALTQTSTGTYTMTVPYSGLSKAAYVNGWIDFNNNGTWDEGESATGGPIQIPAGRAAGTVTIPFTIPSGGLPVTAEGLNTRIRIAYTAADVTLPTGMAASGEVEDHKLPVTASAPDLLVKKNATVVERGTADGNATVGSIVRYDITITNNSPFEATGVTARDTMPTGMRFLPDHEGTSAGITATGNVLRWGPTTLGVGESTTVTYFAEALSAGTHENVVVVTADGGCEDDDSCTDEEETVVDHAGKLSIVKSTPDLADDEVVSFGQEILYRLTVTNESTETVDQIEVEDALVEAAGGQQCVLGSTTLEPGDDTYCEVTYTVTRADVTAGTVLNHATATGKWPDGSDVPGGSDDKENPAAAPDILVEKTGQVVEGATADGGATVGSIIRYRVTITNRSVFDATGVRASDTMPTGVAFVADHEGTSDGLTRDGRTVRWGPADLAAGDSVTLTYFGRATAVGTQRNVVVVDTDGGCVTEGASEPCTDDSSTDVDRSGQLRIVKSTPGLADDAVLTGGQRVTYRLTVTNDSTETVENIEVDDELVQTQGQRCVLGATTLAPGAETSCEVTYIVTRADVRAGKVLNHATAKGEWPDGSDVPGGSDDKENPAQAPDLLVDKTATVVEKAAADGKATVGSIVRYDVTVTNRSAFDAHGVTARDAMPTGMRFLDGHEGTSAGVTHSGGIVSWGPLRLGPQETATWTYFAQATGVGTQRNTVVVDSDGGCKDEDNCTDDSTTDVDHSGELRLVKSTPGLADDAVFTLGQHVTYRVTVTNESDEPVSNVSVEDPLVEGQGRTCIPASTTLAPRASTFCDVVYVVTQADVDAGKVLNHATAKGEWPDGTDVPGGSDDKENPAGTGEGGLVIDKTATVGGGKSTAKEGDTITFRITGTNTSDRTLSNVTIRDEMLAGAGAQLTCTPGNPVKTLAPGARVNCTATYTVTAADAKAGRVHNVATGSAELPGGDPANVVPGESTTKTTTPPADKKQLPWTGAAGLGAMILIAGSLIGGGFLTLYTRRRTRSGER